MGGKGEQKKQTLRINARVFPPQPALSVVYRIDVAAYYGSRTPDHFFKMEPILYISKSYKKG